MSSIQVATNAESEKNVSKPPSVQSIGMNTFQIEFCPTIHTPLSRILRHENCAASGPCAHERECICSSTAKVFNAAKLNFIWYLLYFEFLHQLLVHVHPLNLVRFTSTPFQLLLVRALHVGKASFGVETANQTSRRGGIWRQQQT